MTTWREARALANDLGRQKPTRVLQLPVGRAAGSTLAADVRCERPLPPFDNSAMDGWAVAGDGPWREGDPVLAGSAPPARPLEPGEARPVATGAPVPPGTATVVRSEHAVRVEGERLIDADPPPGPGSHIRRAGEEAAPGEVVLRAGAVLSPPALGLLAASGVGQVDICAPPLVTFVAIGDELAGPEPAPGRVTDSLTPMMPSLLAALGARCSTTARALDRAADVAAAIRRAQTETVVTSGGTAHGPADPVRDALARLDARILIDGVGLRPGGSLLLALLPDGRHVLSLPGNPLAAVVALLVVGWPLVRGRLGRPAPEWDAVPEGMVGGLREIGAVGGRDRAVVCVADRGTLTPVPYQRPGMLRGVATATRLAIVGADGVSVLRLPWACD